MRLRIGKEESPAEPGLFRRASRVRMRKREAGASLFATKEHSKDVGPHLHEKTRQYKGSALAHDTKLPRA